MDMSAGSSVPMSSSGWLAGSSVTVTMYSTPIDLGTYVANADGTLSGTLIIPANAPVGNHTVVLSGTAANGATATAQLAFQIVADPTAATPATPAPLALAC